MKKLKSIELYRNFPVIDQKQNSNFILKLFPFFFQKLKKNNVDRNTFCWC